MIENTKSTDKTHIKPHVVIWTHDIDILTHVKTFIIRLNFVNFSNFVLYTRSLTLYLYILPTA